MKKTLLLAVVLLFAFQLKAQEKVSEYSMNYFNDKNYNIEASDVKGEEFRYYIDCASWEDDTDVVGISFESTKIQEFQNKMNEIKDKYVEWTNTAKQNGVTNFDKNFDIKLPSVNCFFMYGDYHFDFYRTPNAYFKVTTDGECYAIISIRDLQASDNQYIKHDGLFMIFSSDEEIDDFINAIDMKHVIEKAEKKANTDNLFK